MFDKVTLTTALDLPVLTKSKIIKLLSKDQQLSIHIFNLPFILEPRQVPEAFSPRATTIPVSTALLPLPFFPGKLGQHIFRYDPQIQN